MCIQSSKIIRFEKMTLDGYSKNGRFRVRESIKTMYARAPRTWWTASGPSTT